MSTLTKHELKNLVSTKNLLDVYEENNFQASSYDLRIGSIFKDKKIWKEIVMRGMKEDFSWKHSAKEYMRLYKKAMDS